jgi:hypothetical protein
MVLEGITRSEIVSKGSKGKSGDKPAERYGALSIIVKLIFRMPYAAKWHEAIDREWCQGGINWSEPGVGPKYVETKLSMFRRKYLGIVADNVRKALGG